MGSQILCNQIADNLKRYVQGEIMKLKFTPGLGVISFGNPSGDAYIKSIRKACDEVGINCFVHYFDEKEANTEAVQMAILQLVIARDIHGILVQTPLPSHLDKYQVFNAISANKDIDCITDINQAYIGTSKALFEPATAQAVVEILQATKTDITGKHCVVVGRSKTVGAPLARMLTALDATVTLCHSKTKFIDHIMHQGDIVISAIGKPNKWKGYHVKDGAIVIDVGINFDENGKMCGDFDRFDLENLKQDVLYTPVPKGVGLVTTAVLMENVLHAATQKR